MFKDKVVVYWLKKKIFIIFFYFSFTKKKMDGQNFSREHQMIQNAFVDPNSDIFLEKNNRKFVEFIKQNPKLKYLKTSEIIEYKNKLSQISRDRQRRILRGRKRYLSTRTWVTYAPMNIRKQIQKKNIKIECSSFTLSKNNLFTSFFLTYVHCISSRRRVLST